MKQATRLHRLLLQVLLLCIVVALPSGTFASAKTDGRQDVDPKEIIVEHLQDSYWWHITTVGEHAISLYLPVIVRSAERGTWYLFSSSRLAGGQSYKGFYIPSEGAHAGKVVERATGGDEVRPLDLSFTKNVLALTVNAVIMLVIFLSVAGGYKRRPRHAMPRGFAGAVEMFVMDVENEVIRKSIGKDYARYSPYLLTAFFFILINNVMGLLPFFPGGANTTGNIAITFVLALCTMVATNLFGNKEYWKEVFWPPVPLWMKLPVPLMPVIELFGVISKPFSLMIRLFANVTAGHMIILALTCLIFMTVRMGVAINTGMSVLSVMLTVFMNCLELLVAYIQAYVFTMLSAVFIGLSRQEAHHQKKNK
jgi:F-type H+-transporting ATPase subunit a